MPGGLTEALESYKTALDEKEAFLEEGEFSGDGDVTQALTDAQTAVSNAVSAVDSSALETQNVINAKILDAQEAKADAEAAIAEVDGLKAIVDAYVASETNLDNASDASDEADAVLAGANATFAGRNASGFGTSGTSGTITLSLADDGSADFDIYTSVDGKLVLDETALEAAEADAEANAVKGLDDLLSAQEAAVTATNAEAAAQTARNSALEDLLTAEEAADEFGTYTAPAAVDENTVVGDDAGEENAPLTADLIQANTLIENLQQDLETRTKLDADVEAAKADVAEMEALNKAIADAKETLEDSEADGGFGVTLTEFSSGTATAENDLFVYSTDADGASVAQFGAAGDDKIYVGDSFTRVDLASDAVFSKEQGDVATLEVFFQQNGSDAVLTFEDKAFAGSGSSTTDDLTQITLTGVNVEDLVLENGFISIA